MEVVVTRVMRVGSLPSVECQALWPCGLMPSRCWWRGDFELSRGEVAVFDEAGGVLVHAHGDDRIGVAEPFGDGRN